MRKRRSTRLAGTMLMIASTATIAIVGTAVSSARPASTVDPPPLRRHPPPPTSALGDSAPRPAAKSGSPDIQIVAVYPEGQVPGQGDESLRLENGGTRFLDLTGWTIDDGEGRAAFPRGAGLAPGRGWWICADPEAFSAVFGHAPDWSWRPGSSGTARRLITIGAGPRLADGGDELVLRDASGDVVDALVYRSGAWPEGIRAGHWTGPGLWPYHPGGIRGSHQLYARKRRPGTRALEYDHDDATAWTTDPLDPTLGRRPLFPGWDLEHRLRPPRHDAPARVEVAIAPDALLDFFLRQFGAARRSIDLLVYTFESPVVAEALAERARSGLEVRVLVEGSPAGGLDLGERFALNRIHEAGGQVYFMDRGGDVAPRYRGMHAKLGLIDDERVLIGSENPNPGAAPADDPADGTAGRRGVYLAIESAPVAAWAAQIIRDDLDPSHHRDIRPFQPRDPERGAPPEDFVPEAAGGGAGYVPIAPRPLVLRQALAMELLSAPENVLDPERGLPALALRAGPGDALRVQQLSEPLYWGDGPSEGRIALNPRVVAYLQAARRGARVRVLLDGYFDDPESSNGNRATARFLNQSARAEGLDLEARLGNPTGKGLHNKMILVESAERWSHVGSINGTEVANKVNRETGISLRSASIHDYLARVFDWDWARSGAHAIHLPHVVR